MFTFPRHKASFKMVLRPRLLLVYLIVFLIFNPQYISTEWVSGKPLKLDFVKSWLPEKETLNMEQGGTALLQFDEKVIDQIDGPFYTQQLELLVRYLGTNYTRIVLRVSHPKIEIFKKTLTKEFLKAVSTENEIRRDQDVNQIDIYLQISLKFFLDRESLEAMQFLVVGLYNSIAKQGNINGLIFEASLIQNPIQRDMNYSQTINDVVYYAVKTFKTFMKTLESTNGHTLKLGLAVSSLEECESSMNGFLGDTMSLFEMVVYKYSGTVQRNQEANECFKLFQNEFPGIEFHKIQQVFEIKTM